MSTVVQLSKFKSVTSKDNNPHTPFERYNFHNKKEKNQLWSTTVTSVWEQSGNLVSGILGDLPLDVACDATYQLAVIEKKYFKLIEILRNYENCVETEEKYMQCVREDNWKI